MEAGDEEAERFKRLRKDLEWALERAYNTAITAVQLGELRGGKDGEGIMILESSCAGVTVKVCENEVWIPASGLEYARDAICRSIQLRDDMEK